ncbi:LANO_0E08988g1_1 [Lachancea nothofagi CBS 11611]|uniref:LANO_0E08988g1_1 n=1 Tax=Lachancea nothofagi CBS 11611 TaxID=1266666 RepID=A0A1G4JVM1_9SACH|nr:LANO_0E08988g1_1 [Lachancea nothofagi CBS 11611]
MFHTPPINESNFDGSQAIRESYRIQVEGSSPDLSNSSSNGNGSLTKEEIASEIEQITELPMDLSRLVDNFIDDLKQPKYLKPLNAVQLSGLFQTFYARFDKASFQCLNKAPDMLNSTFFTARETLSSGISGIFNRSRSSSDTARKRSSSLFSTDSTSGIQPMLSPEEINKHLRMTELNNYRIEKLLELCEHDMFKKILEVGTSVPNNVSKLGKPQRDLKVTNLFKNSPEFLEFDRAVFEKIVVLSEITKSGKIDMMDFLSVPQQNLDSSKLTAHLDKMVYGPLAPYEKLLNVIKLHDEMTKSLNHLSNDDFLSTLIYLIIQTPVKHIFLDLQFIKLFRYNKKLVEKDLYALTNLEAALTFIEGLTFESLPVEAQKELAGDELILLQTPISQKIALPEVQVSSNDSSQRYSGLPRSNSYKEFEGLRTAFDSSLRNIFGKIRSYTPPVAPQPPATQDKLPNGVLNLPASSDIDLSKKRLPIEDSWKSLRNREFEDLKLSEMRQVFENYQKLLDALDSQ